MENNQYPVIESANNVENAAPATKENKSKTKVFIIIVFVVLVIIGVIVTAVLLLSGKGDQSAPAKKNSPSAALQIYSALEEEIPIEEIESAVKDINGEATVTFDDGYGVIKVSDADYVSFYYESDKQADEEATNVEPEEDVADEPEEKVVAPNTAYGFTYVMPISDDDNSTISCADVCYYNDGLENHEYKTKQEAIDAFLSPTTK